MDESGPNRAGMSMSVHCPKCGSDVIREKNIAVTNLEVIGWEWDEKAETVQPTDYETDNDPEWEANDVENQYTCGMGTCDWEGSLDDLRVHWEGGY